MDTGVVVALISLVEGIGVVIIGGMIAAYNRNNKEYREMREKRDTAIYNLLFADVGGTEVLLHKAHGDKLNGDVDEALGKIKSAKGKCNEVFNEFVSKIGG